MGNAKSASAALLANLRQISFRRVATTLAAEIHTDPRRLFYILTSRMLQWVNMRHETVHSKETQSLASKIVKELLAAEKKKNHATVIALYGDLGGGKTTFTQGVAKALGVKETVPSPTFIIERIYKINKKSFTPTPKNFGVSSQDERGFTRFIHIDAYRLENSTELKNIGWEEMIQNPKNFIMIEWANKIESVLPKDAIKIYFEHAGENKRKIIVKI